RRHLDEPDDRLDRFDLAEEWPQSAELVMAPVSEEPRRLGSHRPVGGVRQLPPRVDCLAQGVDDGRWIVLLALGREPHGIREKELSLPYPSLLRLGNRRHVLRRPPPLDHPVRRLTALVELPVPRGILVGRVEDRTVKKRLRHLAEDISLLACPRGSPATPFLASALPFGPSDTPLGSTAKSFLSSALSFGSPAMPFVTSATPFVTNATSFGPSALPFVSTAVPLVSTAMPLVSTAMPFVSTAMPFLTNHLPFASSATAFGLSALPFVTSATPNLTSETLCTNS